MTYASDKTLDLLTAAVHSSVDDLFGDIPAEVGTSKAHALAAAGLATILMRKATRWSKTGPQPGAPATCKPSVRT